MKILFFKRVFKFFLAALVLYLLHCFITMQFTNPFGEYIGDTGVRGDFFRLIWFLTAGAIAISD